MRSLSGWNKHVAVGVNLGEVSVIVLGNITNLLEHSRFLELYVLAHT